MLILESNCLHYTFYNIIQWVFTLGNSCGGPTRAMKNHCRLLYSSYHIVSFINDVQTSKLWFNDHQDVIKPYIVICYYFGSSKLFATYF